MEMIMINGEIISLNNIWNISKIENKDERIIIINYVVDGKIIRYELDYSDVKDDVNEEKTKLEQDYEMVVNCLVSDWIELEKYEKLEEKYKDLLHDYMIANDQKNLYYDIIKKIKAECRKKKICVRKIKRIKEIFYE